MKKEYNLTIVYDTETEEIDSYTTALDEEEEEIYFDNGDEVIKMPAAILKYIDDASILGIT